MQHGVSGKILSGDIVVSERFKVKFENFVIEGQLESSHVSNVSETDLNYKMFPKKTLASKINSAAKGHKVKK